MPKKSREQIKVKAKEAVAEFLDVVVKEQEEAQAERIPGKVIRGVKTSWTRNDVDRLFPPVTILPEETIPVTYNGVQYQLIADREMVVPSIIRDIYLEYRRRRRQGSTRNLSVLDVKVVGQGGLVE